LDVTKRYTKNWPEVLKRRTRVTEEWLASYISTQEAKLQLTLPEQRKQILYSRRSVEVAEFEIKDEHLKEEEKKGRVSGIGYNCSLLTCKGSKEWKEQRKETGKDNVPQ
jgi:peptide-N4-(N-acetyl-beta-glucosaminyl)asparagine amidase